MKKEIDNLLVSQNLYSKNYKIDEDWENLINKYLKCRKLNKELADAFVDKVQVFEDGRISVNLVYDDCLEELLQVKNKREGDLYEYERAVQETPESLAFEEELIHRFRLQDDKK